MIVISSSSMSATCRRKAVMALRERRTRKPLIGLSATRLSESGWAMTTSTSSTSPRRTLLPKLVTLVPMRVLAPEAQVRTEGLKVSTAGEWAKADVAERVLEIVGDAVSEYEKLCRAEYEGVPVPAIAFAATVADSEALAQQFRTAGFDFQVISYQQSAHEKDAIIAPFSRRWSPWACLLCGA